MSDVSTDIADLRRLLDQLRGADRRRRVFGSKQHGYRLGRTLTEAELAAFEASHSITLPQDYHIFLATIGNGGAGPFYGLEPLDSFRRDLSRPFQFTRATDQFTPAELDSFGDRDAYPGILEFCHQGCAIYSYLVVSGPTYGTIWEG